MNAEAQMRERFDALENGLDEKLLDGATQAVFETDRDSKGTAPFRTLAAAALASAARTAEEKGYVLVPAEPTVSMVEAAFKSIRFWNKGTKDCVKFWAPRASKPHPHEPGIVTELRAAIAAGRVAKLPHIVKEPS